MDIVVAGEHIQITAIAFKEGDAWVAQGIEYDIVAQAHDVVALPKAFLRAVMENICISEHLGRKPLEGIRAAPDRFKEMFEESAIEMRTVGKAQAGAEVAVRVWEQAA